MFGDDNFDIICNKNDTLSICYHSLLTYNIGLDFRWNKSIIGENQ